MTFQSSHCKQCARKFSFTAKPCNRCKKVIVDLCWNCHKIEHKYSITSEHGYIKSKYLTLLASFTVLAVGTIQIIHFLGQLQT